jgi:malate dehydrogenase (oxaloacetate-decarboxylating)
MPDPEELLAKARRPAEDALRWHPFYRGKIQMIPKCAIRSFADLAVWYTPGVAAASRAVAENPDDVFLHTNKGNTVAIVTDGTRVLGLGDIGPHAALPVMEGKALLFKYLGGVDAVPICLNTKEPEEIIRTVELLEPSFGGINLEDIAHPKCFAVLDALRERMQIPVWHDDQQGTSTVVLAGLSNALKVVGKELSNVRITFIGAGAANVAVYRLLKAAGINLKLVVACDRGGILHPGRTDLERRQDEFRDKWAICRETNSEGRSGGIEEALRGSDVCLAFSAPGPGIIRPEWLSGMANDAIVFVCANPVPEIWPWEASEAGVRIIATGRGDFPNQVNNSLAFPAIFRGALDVRARAITDRMAMAAAQALAESAAESGLHEEHIVPRMDDLDVVPRVAFATASAAEAEGIAQLPLDRDAFLENATRQIRDTRRTLETLMEDGVIPPPPT